MYCVFVLFFFLFFYINIFVVSIVFLFSHNATEAYLEDDVDDFDDPFGDIPFRKLPLNLYPCECVLTEFITLVLKEYIWLCFIYLCDSIHVLVKYRVVSCVASINLIHLS